MAASSAAKMLLLLAIARGAAGLSIVADQAGSGASAPSFLRLALGSDDDTLEKVSPAASTNSTAGVNRSGPNDPLLYTMPAAEIKQQQQAILPVHSSRVKEDFQMAAAIVGTPLILFLLRSDALKKPSLAVIMLVSLMYILASLAMNILNKKVTKAFEGTCLLVIIQMLVSVVVITCMERSKMKMDKWTDFMKWLIVPFAFAGMLGTSMFAFKEASLTTILIMRNILPILTFGFEKALFNQPESLCWKVISSLVVTLVGSILYGVVDISATNLGKVLILVNCAFTVVDRLVQAYLLRCNKDFSISISMCMLLNNSLGIFPMLCLAMVTGEMAQWRDSIASTDMNTWFLVVMSGLCGASLAYVGLRTQQLVSGTTVLVLQNLNKLLIISIGMGLFHERLTLTSCQGCILSLLGCLAYGYLRLPSEAKAKSPLKKDPTSDALHLLAEASKLAKEGAETHGMQKTTSNA